MSAAGSQSSNLVDCPSGYYCLLATPLGQAIACPAGTYTPPPDNTRLSNSGNCTICTSGSYCLGGQSQVSGACAPGFWCPAGSISPTANPCPAGAYSASTSLTVSSSCSATAKGYYTLAGVSAMVPCPSGRYTSVTNTVAASEGGPVPYCLPCSAGSYCSSGSSAPTNCGSGFYSASLASVCTPCPLGTYCSSATTTATMLVTDGGSWNKSSDLSGMCFPGTLCGLGEVAIPNLSTKPVPAGYYAPAGATYAIPCPAGKYLAQLGSGSLADCMTTPAGYYSLSASTSYSICSPGYYCLSGSSSPQQSPCPAGRYSADSGAEALSSCSASPVGTYSPVASSSPLTCPRGYYCIVSTAQPEPCRPSSYGATYGLRSADECTTCDPGSYCDGYGLQNPRGLCSPGFFCRSGSNSSAPSNFNSTAVQNANYGRCPKGAFCGLGTITPQLCAQGTYNGNTGSKTIADCTPCHSGSYTPSTGATSCITVAAGSFASINGIAIAIGATGTTTCPAGTTSFIGASSCTPCASGYYALSGASLCSLVAAGYYSSTLGGVACNGGCPSYTACLAGSYSSAGASECTPCSAGYYSSSDALSQCSACPVGAFAASAGATACTLCVPGNYNPSTSQSACTPCPAGFACTVAGLTASDEICGPGFWCAKGASQVNAYCTSSTCLGDYGICPKGSYCPAGSFAPLSCQAGSYQNSIGQAACIQCPARHESLTLSLTLTLTLTLTPAHTLNLNLTSPPTHRHECAITGASNYTSCPITKYCPAGSSLGLLCPDGTYNNVTGLALSSECTACPAGQYCTGGVVAGYCSAGYFCKVRRGVGELKFIYLTYNIYYHNYY